MRLSRILIALPLAAIIASPACGLPVRDQIGPQARRLEPASEAWEAARLRLHKMCPRVPKTDDELAAALSTEQDNGCYARFAKDGPVPTREDWHWHWLPPYRVVAAVHEQELRKRITPKLYEEYMSGLNRFLADKADKGEITPAQFRYVFTAGWNWVTGKVEKQRVLLDENVPSFEKADAIRQRMLSDVAGELATVATVALAISAPDKTYQPAPANCYAYPQEERTYTIQCY